MGSGLYFRRGAGSDNPIRARLTSGSARTAWVATIIALAALWVQAPPVGATGPAPVSVTPYSGFNPLLSRAPYLSDLTQTSVEVNWAETTSDPTLGAYASLAGYVAWGRAGTSCNANTAPVPSSLPTLVPASDTPASVTGREFTVGTVTPVTEYQSSVRLTGMSPGSSYCYRVFGYYYYGITKTPTDLLGSNPSPTFTTLDPVSDSSASPLTFDVLGDTGEACVTVLPCTSTSPNLINPDQAAIDQLIGQSGARFLLMAGDVGYPSGLQTRYGDLQQQGTAGPTGDPDISNMFGPNYWPQTGGLPTYYADGNHGLDVTSLRVWPESATAAASNGGVYGDVPYPASTADGTPAVSYPANWYAFSTGNVRIYMLTAAWADGNVGTATGGSCGSLCSAYQLDSDYHWQTTSAEYQWLKQDLAAHPGGIKLAVWHYPLRSYSSSQVSDPFLQNSSANVSALAAQDSLESLLAQNGVAIAFNAHAHTYQRIDPGLPGQIVNYVTGGGGGVLGSVSCSLVTGVTSAYALGWDPAAGVGSSCGVAGGVASSIPVPASSAQVYNFLKVTVAGNTVTVTPTNAAGQTFDVQTYEAAMPTVSEITPSASSIAGGTAVTIYGSNVAQVSSVSFGLNPSPSFAVASPNSVIAVAPAGSAGPVDVSVTTPDGTSAPTPADLFTYTAGPVVANVVPHAGAGGGGTLIRITGTGFAGTGITTTGVNVGGLAITSACPAVSCFTVNSPTLITAITPAESSGQVDVTVTTSAGSSPVVATDRFTFELPQLLAVDFASTWAATSTFSHFNNPVALSSSPFYGSVATLVGDVNGDGIPDLIAVDGNEIWVMLGTTTGFSAPELWSTTPFYGSVTTLVGDVNGDGIADLIAVDQGSVWVLQSTGTGFLQPVQWSTQPFYGTVSTSVGDVNGDGMADLIAVNAASTWVMTSTGNGFSAPSEWSADPFYGSIATLVGDVTGDGTADLIAVNPTSAWVMSSTGTGFAAPMPWSSNPFYGSRATVALDLGGTGKVDLVAVDDSATWVMMSTGSNFNPPAAWLSVPFYGSVETVPSG